MRSGREGRQIPVQHRLAVARDLLLFVDLLLHVQPIYIVHVYECMHYITSRES